MCKLTEMKAKDGNDIIKHLAKIKQLWDWIMLVCADDLPLTPKLFKKFLAYSLPPSWDKFTRQYRRDPDKQGINIHHFIRECNEEYRRHQKHEHENGNGNHSAYANANSKKTLINWIGKKTSKYPNMECIHCTYCSRDNHKVENCYHTAKPKCTICKWIGHKAENCHFKKKAQKPWKDKNNIVAEATSTKGEAHIMEIGSDEEALMACNAEIPTLYDNPFYKDISDLNVYTNIATNESACMYDWLADTRLTNHITN